MYPREMYPGELVSVNGDWVMRICCFDDMLGPLLVKMMIFIFLTYELTNKWTEVFHEVLVDLKMLSLMSKPYYSVGVREKKRDAHYI